MKILVIKQTSLGDVLHSTGHVRTIKQYYPKAHLTVLTATTCAEIYRYNKWVDHLILIDRNYLKMNWLQQPGRCYRHIRSVMRMVRLHQYDLAFDLQGLAKSVLFLYGAPAQQKFVKGNWLGLRSFRQPQLHAIKEMDGVLRLAGIDLVDTSMEITTPPVVKTRIDQLLEKIHHHGALWIFSPFSRWPSKDWPLSYFVETANAVSDRATILFAGTDNCKEIINNALSQVSNHNIINVAGQLTISEFAELVDRADGMLTGDSFPMHIAVAQKTPVIALFAPTDEHKVGPTSVLDQVIRAPDCQGCDHKNCKQACLARIPAAKIISAIECQL